MNPTGGLAAICSNNVSKAQLLQPFRDRSNFLEDKIPGCCSPGPAAATACYFIACPLQHPPSQKLAPQFAFLAAAALCALRASGVHLVSKKIPRPLNSSMRSNASGMNYQQRNRALSECIREPCERAVCDPDVAEVYTADTTACLMFYA